QKPTREFGVGGSAEFGNFNTNNFTAWINMPVSDMLRLRVSGSSRRHDGYRRITPSNGVPAFRADDEDSHSLRFPADFTPFENFEASFLFPSTPIGGAGVASNRILFNPGITPAPTPDNPNPVQDISHDKPDLGDPRNFPLYGPLSQDIDDKVYKWQISY